MMNQDTIVAISTPYGTGGIAVIRLSGPEALEIADRVWKGKPLAEAPSHTAHLGTITGDAECEELDHAVATLFRGPRSFTGEDTVEFSVHGSKWIQRKVVERLVEAGARPAEPGEFTRRAFMNGRMDLAQAEGVAELIAASSRAAHRLAMSQMTGSFSSRLNELRDHLIDLASLLELELDFSEEDVEFADRSRLTAITAETLELMDRLASTYAAGKAFKEGVPVAIAGRPNAGKSTLLNRLLGEEKAIVSDVAGTTRDVIEDTREIGGILFRFFDTAGLRETDDSVERIGIDRAHNAIDRASIVMWLVDLSATPEEIDDTREYIKIQVIAHPQSKHIVVFNKCEMVDGNGKNPDVRIEGEDSDSWLADLDRESENSQMDPKSVEDTKNRGTGSRIMCVSISAKSGENVESLEKALTALAKTDHDPDAEMIVTNVRHYAALRQGADALRRAKEGIRTGLSADFITQDVREALHHLGELTGTVSTDTLLSTIFSRFCIGK